MSAVTAVAVVLTQADRAHTALRLRPRSQPLLSCRVSVTIDSVSRDGLRFPAHTDRTDKYHSLSTVRPPFAHFSAAAPHLPQDHP